MLTPKTKKQLNSRLVTGQSRKNTKKANMGKRIVNALMVGAGEYTTGSVFTAAGAAPDKPAGVIAITFTDFETSRKNKRNHVSRCGWDENACCSRHDAKEDCREV